MQGLYSEGFQKRQDLGNFFSYNYICVTYFAQLKIYRKLCNLRFNHFLLLSFFISVNHKNDTNDPD